MKKSKPKLVGFRPTVLIRETAVDAAMMIHYEKLGTEVAVIRLVGRLTLGQRSEQLDDLVEELLSAGKRTIVLDLTEITTIDSTGIGRFISSYNKICSAGAEMRMAGAPEPLSKVFRVTRLDTVFLFYATLAEALEG